jgi:secreted trypsin-like serine protease
LFVEVSNSCYSQYIYFTHPDCGKHKENHQQSRIVGGTVAPKETWGWQVKRLLQNKFFYITLYHSFCFFFYIKKVRIYRDKEFICGGSLITENWIITSANCVHGFTNPSSYRIDIGVQDVDDYDYWSISRQVSQIVKHPQFNHFYLHNNIALIKLSVRTL